MTDHPTPPHPGATTRRTMLAAAAAATVGVMAADAASPDSARADGRLGRRFAGKTVLITGATSGIGKAAAYAFAREGARVCFCGRRVELGARNEQEIRAFGGDATYVRADVRRESDVAALVQACVRRYGRIDVAFNNAGIESPRAVPVHEQNLADFENVWRTNTAGVFLSMKYELPVLLRQGRGVIINTASVSAEVGFATIAPYSASKHGVAALSKIGGLEYADKGIRVNAVAPGAVDTPMLQRAAAAFGMTYEQIAQDYPVKRIIAAEEIARVVLWLASDDASPIVGTDVDATGGYLSK